MVSNTGAGPRDPWLGAGALSACTAGCSHGGVRRTSRANDSTPSHFFRMPGDRPSHHGSCPEPAATDGAGTHAYWLMASCDSTCADVQLQVCFISSIIPVQCLLLDHCTTAAWPYAVIHGKFCKFSSFTIPLHVWWATKYHLSVTWALRCCNPVQCYHSVAETYMERLKIM